MKSTTTQTMTTIRLLLAMTATLALALGIAFASPAAAQFVDESDDGANEEQADEDEAPAEDEATVEDEATADEDAPASNGNGFVGNDHDDDHEAAPVGGIDAGFGGASEQAGFGAAHAGAMALLVLALTGHAANARRTSSVRA